MFYWLCVGALILAGGAKDWADARGWYVEPGLADTPDIVVWVTSQAIRRAILEPVTSEPGGSGSPPLEGSPLPGSPGATESVVP